MTYSPTQMTTMRLLVSESLSDEETQKLFFENYTGCEITPTEFEENYMGD